MPNSYVDKLKRKFLQRFTPEEKNNNFKNIYADISNKAGRYNFLIGITGSVASIKLEEILIKFKTVFPEINICLISTNSALHFINIHQFNQKPSLIERLNYLKNTNSNCLITFKEEEEWSSWKSINDPVLHIELRKWADVFLISPLNANTLSKLSNGSCDNLISCVARAWDFRKPIIVCPAMNTLMYEHPITKQQLSILKAWNYTIIEPIEKILASGDYGKGAMATADTIVNKTVEILKMITIN
jgi:phosphopantothenoylcysteine decarboxylase